MTLHDEATCYRCGANAWTSCQHREATRQPPVDDGYKDRREKAALKGGGGRYGFKTTSSGIHFKAKRKRTD